MGPPRMHVPSPSSCAARHMFSPIRPTLIIDMPVSSSGHAMANTAIPLRNPLRNLGSSALTKPGMSTFMSSVTSLR